MFSDAESFNQPLDKWNVSKVKNMNYMFADATSFNQPLHAPWYVVEQSESE
jgi:surface protein